MGRGALAALKVAVVVMGVLIIGGVAILVVTVARRLGGPVAAVATPLLLDEPAGTVIAAVAASGDRVVLQLRGGGPDRVVAVDGRGIVVARIGLAR